MTPLTLPKYSLIIFVRHSQLCKLLGTVVINQHFIVSGYHLFTIKKVLSVKK